MENRERELAKSFVLHTDRNIFLTGKAGTGKTTLLKEILEETDKQTAVVAPTGVAAINAGGMTIHSFFQLPITTFLPIPQSLEDPDIFTDRNRLASNQRIRKERRNVLLELELLIIDEISMVRADLLDAIDFTLRRIRKINKAFGGVQVLVIGDLYQLAPVVKNYEAQILKDFYTSRFFFDSKVWHQCSPLVIELKKIYRQEDNQFIEILNNIRNGIHQEADLVVLNRQYQKQPNSNNRICLTTHNRKADQINQTELAKLSGATYKLKAEVKGQFSESAYPTAESIELKTGSQIMFIRNHPDGLYYNGKLGVVSDIGDDQIIVSDAEDASTISVKPIEWKNTRYRMDKTSNNLIQEDIGQFKQYPIKLAWAVTVHKSQGLTFDQVILDLEHTFAPGQLYVALSRCRSLEGMKLSSKIKPENVIVNPRIVNYHKSNSLSIEIDQILSLEKRKYEEQQVLKRFQFNKLDVLFDEWNQLIADSDIPKQADVLVLAQRLKQDFQRLNAIGRKFQVQLQKLIQNQKDGEDKIEKVVKRLTEAVKYFSEQIYEKLIKELQSHYSSYKVKKGSKKYSREMKPLLDQSWTILNNLYRLKYRDQKIWKEPKIIDKSKPSKKENTKDVTLKLYQGGMDFNEIASARDLTLGTVRSHMTHWISVGKIPIGAVMEESRLNKFKPFYEDFVSDLTSSEIKGKIPFHSEWYELRWIRAHLQYHIEKD